MRPERSSCFRRTRKIKSLLRILALSTAILASVILPAGAQLGTWIQVTDPLAAFTGKECFALECSSTGDVYLGGSGGLYHSSDRGITWIPEIGLPASKPATAIAWNGLGELVCAVGQNTDPSTAWLNRGGVWLQATGISASKRITKFTLDKLMRLVAVTSWHADVFQSADFGATYTRIAQAVGGSGTTSAGALWTVARGPDGSLYTGGELPTGIYRSLDDGVTWLQFGLSSTLNYKGNLTVIAFNQAGDVLANRQYNGLPIQRYSALGWVTSSQGLPTYYSCTGIVMNPASGAMYCCLFQLSKHLGVVYKSIDGGATWTAFGDGLPNTGIQKLAISADGYLYAYNGGGGMYRTVLPVQ